MAYLTAAPADISRVQLANSSPGWWETIGARGLDVGEDFLRKLLGLPGGANAAPAGSYELEAMLAEQRAAQQRTLLLVGGGAVALVLLVVLLKK